jgi:hypothetical protein
MLKFFGGSNKKMEINELSIGTMDEVVYPARGTLDDWAYAGSWFSSVPPTCNNY